MPVTVLLQVEDVLLGMARVINLKMLHSALNSLLKDLDGSIPIILKTSMSKDRDSSQLNCSCNSVPKRKHFLFK